MFFNKPNGSKAKRDLKCKCSGKSGCYTGKIKETNAAFTLKFDILSPPGTQ